MLDLTTVSQEDIALLAWKQREIHLNNEIKQLEVELEVYEKPFTDFVEQKKVEFEAKWIEQIAKINEKLSLLDFEIKFKKVCIWWTNRNYNIRYDSGDWKSYIRLEFITIDLKEQFDEDGDLIDCSCDEFMKFMVERCVPDFKDCETVSFKKNYPTEYSKAEELYYSILRIKKQFDLKDKYIEDVRAGLTLHKLQNNEHLNSIFTKTLENVTLLNQ